ADQILLRFPKDADVRNESLEGLAAAERTHQVPGGIEDVLLDADQFAHFSTGLAAGHAAARRSFSQDVLEEPHFGKKLVTGAAADLAILVPVLGPEVVGQKLAFPGSEGFDVDEGRKEVLGSPGQSVGGEDGFFLLAPKGVAQSRAQNLDVVPDLSFQGEFLQGGDFEVATGEEKL